MYIVWSTVIGILAFLALVVVILLFGAAANKAEKEARIRTERERGAGPTGGSTSDTSHPVQDSSVNA